MIWWILCIALQALFVWHLIWRDIDRRWPKGDDDWTDHGGVHDTLMRHTDHTGYLDLHSQSSYLLGSQDRSARNEIEMIS